MDGINGHNMKECMRLQEVMTGLDAIELYQGCLGLDNAVVTICSFTPSLIALEAWEISGA